MPQNVYLYDRLVLGFEGNIRREPGSDADKLSMIITIKNPLGSTSSTRRPPNMEIWDSAGRVYETTNADWAEPVLPDTEIARRVEFEIPADAEDLELVFGPGEPDEVHAPLSETAGGDGET